MFGKDLIKNKKIIQLKKCSKMKYIFLHTAINVKFQKVIRNKQLCILIMKRTLA